MQLEILIGPLIGAVGTIAAAWVGHRYRQQATRSEPEPPAGQSLIWVPASVHGDGEGSQRRRRRLRLRRRAGKKRRSVRSLPAAVPAFVRFLWRAMSRVPPAHRRTRPAVAAAVGWLPFGPAAYFRTGPDVLASLAFFALMGIGVDRFPDTEAEEAGATAPTWAYAVFYTALLFSGLYSYLRSLSSNREIEARRVARLAETPSPEGIPELRSTDERRRLLERRLERFSDDGWKVAARSDFGAVVVLTPKTDHRRQAKLTALTLGLWTLPWIYLAFLRGEERELFVDRWGTVHVEVPGTAPIQPAAA